MLTNIYIPKWVRWLIVLTILVQGVMGLARIVEIGMRLSTASASGSSSDTALMLRHAAELERTTQELRRCERYGQSMDERLADEREAAQR